MRLVEDKTYKFSKIIARIAGSTRKNGVSVGRLMKLIGRSSIYIFIFLTFLIMALPLPFPPGTITILSIPALLMTGQRLCNVEKLWLPKFLTSFRIGQGFIQKVNLLSQKHLRNFEKLMKSRWNILFSPFMTKINDILLFCCALLSAIPIPLVCFLPIIAGLAISAGLAMKDGVLTIIGWIFLAIGAVVIFSTIHGVFVVSKVVPTLL